MIRSACPSFPFAHALSAAFVATLVACSGAVNPPTTVNDPGKITVLPATSSAAPAILYSGLPTTFSITGGTGSYIVSSSNQAVIQVSGNIPGTALTVIPNPVASDTTLTLTVRDTGTTPTASAALLVKPGTVNNTITIAHSSTRCDPAICSGDDALVSVTISQGGIPLGARGVKFDVVSGDFRFITSAPGLPEVLSTTASVFTDEKGGAQIRIRVLPAAPNQLGLMQVTDVGSGAYQRASILIAQSTGTSPGFVAVPETVTFTGPLPNQCASGANSPAGAAVFIFGGSPPYNISNTAGAAFIVTPSVVSVSGGSFNIDPTGLCIDKGIIVVTDSAGHSLNVQVTNAPGSAPASPLVVSPTTVQLSSCQSVAGISVGGGTGNYRATPGNGLIVSATGANGFSIQRANPSAAVTSPVNVGVTDGVTTQDVVVNLTGNALGPCPTTLTANPNTVTLSSCASAPTVTISGGSGSYTVSSNSSTVTATLGTGANSNVVTIMRTAGSGLPPPTNPVVTVKDATDPGVLTNITVIAGGSGNC